MSDARGVEFVEDGTCYVDARCPRCGRFVTVGQVSVDGLGRTHLRGFRCLRCGDVEPEYEWL